MALLLGEKLEKSKYGICLGENSFLSTLSQLTFNTELRLPHSVTQTYSLPHLLGLTLNNTLKSPQSIPAVVTDVRPGMKNSLVMASQLSESSVIQKHIEK